MWAMMQKFRVRVCGIKSARKRAAHYGGRGRHGQPACRLTDGRADAVIVAALGGRLLHYGLVNGANWMWTGEPGAERAADALMWGGAKTYIGPHTSWNFTQSRMWPPPTAPNEQAHEI